MVVFAIHRHLEIMDVMIVAAAIIFFVGLISILSPRPRPVSNPPLASSDPVYRKSNSSLFDFVKLVLYVLLIAVILEHYFGVPVSAFMENILQSVH